MVDAVKNKQEEDWKRILRSYINLGLTGAPQEKTEALRQVGYYYQCYAPVSLYKYYSEKPRNLAMVKANQMWYSAPSNFNDVFDCDISIKEDEVFKSVMRMFPDARGVRKGSYKWKELSGIVHQELNSLKSVFEELKSSIGIACLSESDDSLLMWAHYANNHHGMCVEYGLPEIVSQLSFSPVPVIYSNKRVSFSSLNLATPEHDALRIFTESITTKSPEWGYEREWRIIRDDSACGDKWDKKKKGALLQVIHPSSITLGCVSEKEFEDEVKNYCKANSVNLYRMEKDPYHYRLNKKALLEFNNK